MPDPIRTICSRLPGAVYNANNDTCRYSEQGNQVLISRNREGILSITGVGNSTAAPGTTEPAPLRARRSKYTNVGISSSAMSRLVEIQTLLLSHSDGLSPEMVEQLNNELKPLQQTVRLGCDIRITLRLLDEAETACRSNSSSHSFFSADVPRVPGSITGRPLRPSTPGRLE